MYHKIEWREPDGCHHDAVHFLLGTGGVAHISVMNR